MLNYKLPKERAFALSQGGRDLLSSGPVRKNEAFQPKHRTFDTKKIEQSGTTLKMVQSNLEDDGVPHASFLGDSEGDM